MSYQKVFLILKLVIDVCVCMGEGGEETLNYRLAVLVLGETCNYRMIVYVSGGGGLVITV